MCGVPSPEKKARALTRTHAPARGRQAAGECRRVRFWLPAGLPPANRSASCASKSVLSGRRRASEKSPAAVTTAADGGGCGGCGGEKEIRRRRRRSE